METKELVQPCWVNSPKTEEERATLKNTITSMNISLGECNLNLSKDTIYLIDKNVVVSCYGYIATIDAIKNTYPELEIPKEEYKFTPFEKVLVRDNDRRHWNVNFFSYIDYSGVRMNKYSCLAFSYKQCIPYKGNEHLLGTTNDPK